MNAGDTLQSNSKMMAKKKQFLASLHLSLGIARPITYKATSGSHVNRHEVVLRISQASNAAFLPINVSVS